MLNNEWSSFKINIQKELKFKIGTIRFQLNIVPKYIDNYDHFLNKIKPIFDNTKAITI